MQKIPVTVKATPTDDPVFKLHENETQEWIHTDKGGEVKQTVTNEEIIDSVTYPKKPTTT
jgi:hypothetical protein